MKVLIDGYWWLDGPRSNRMVLLEIVRQWVGDYPQDDVILAVPAARTWPQDAHPPEGVEVLATHLRMHPVINSIELPAIARRHSVDAILAFNFAAPSSRGFVFLHDVLFQSNPEWFTGIERAYYSAMPVLARYAHGVMATSNSERNRIEKWNPRLRRVVACGLSTSPSLTAAVPKDPGLGLSHNSFVLCVGRLNIRKNLSVTMRALQQSGLLSTKFPLVVVGEQSGRAADLCEFTDAVSDRTIILTESVTDNELKWLYSNCKLFVCLPSDEGFGLPPVEAAKCGAPVLVSDLPVFRETLGSYATFVAPTDTDAIAEHARRMVTNDSRPSKSYTERYSWSSVCMAIRDELQLATPKPRSRIHWARAALVPDWRA
ncbi:MAG: glycosyltransferase family 1 protein [Mycobacterium sp.]|nr:glycosyltransferase family 1 protein [Mycobacterium sp.]